MHITFYNILTDILRKPVGLTSSCAVVLQLVAVHRLLGVRPLPAGAANIERQQRGEGMNESVNGILAV